MTTLPRNSPLWLPPVGHDIGRGAEGFRDRLIATKGLDQFVFHASLSQIVKRNASPDYHKMMVEGIFHPAHIRSMDDQAKNGGPNYLREWRTFRNMTQEQLAKEIGTAPNVIQYLETGERGLSAKWLRKLAPALKTTAGLLLDHDPHTLDKDLLDIWGRADDRQKRQISDIAQTITRTGTDNLP